MGQLAEGDAARRIDERNGVGLLSGDAVERSDHGGVASHRRRRPGGQAQRAPDRRRSADEFDERGEEVVDQLPSEPLVEPIQIDVDLEADAVDVRPP